MVYSTDTAVERELSGECQYPWQINRPR